MAKAGRNKAIWDLLSKVARTALGGARIQRQFAYPTTRAYSVAAQNPVYGLDTGANARTMNLRGTG
jgi:hypothetical protein